MSTDRELLEMAAKAAGISIVRSRLEDPMWRDMLLEPKHGIGIGWNPLEDDGDALRLAIQLQIEIKPATDSGFALCKAASMKTGIAETCIFDGDPWIATRRAIVRAAAEIGRNLP
ncbi:hypothetical protein [Herbaspirillum huttiense]|uniref:hypothetical protein n=1 Tax=Herbaspirillum huttiense TaxID=863372 RepID=UPI002E77F1A3|nr:hypothetical protein [Herbaspirillum huttiense]MEE1636403.1 hypothetical protein [Herbaspirillum huttiense NC40101]